MYRRSIPSPAPSFFPTTTTLNAYGLLDSSITPFLSIISICSSIYWCSFGVWYPIFPTTGTSLTNLMTLLAFSNEVQSHVMEGYEKMEHMICHRSTKVQDVMCQQQSEDLKHMIELEALLADWLGEGSTEVQGLTERSAV